LLEEYTISVGEVARWAEQAITQATPPCRTDEQIYSDVHFEADLARIVLDRLNQHKTEDDE
jgi:hypothetical protein